MALTGSAKVEVLSIQQVTNTSQVSGWGKGLNLTYNLTGQKDGEWRGSRANGNIGVIASHWKCIQ